jgi:hypothetical protein
MASKPVIYWRASNYEDWSLNNFGNYYGYSWPEGDGIGHTDGTSFGLSSANSVHLDLLSRSVRPEVLIWSTAI